jgi:hypothetical protein
MTEDAMRADGSLADVLPDEFSKVAWTPALASMAHPSWAGCDSFFFEGRSPDGVQLLARCLRSSAALRTDYSAMFAAMEAAGAAGLAPPVLFHDAARGVCVLEKLSDAWRVATLYRLLDADALQASLRVRLSFRELDADLPRVSVFEQVATLLAYMSDQAVPLSADAREVIAAVEEARGCLRDGPEPVACHGDGTVSNVMLCAGKARLVGWTQAGRMDPLEEVGSVLTDLVPFIADAETVFASMWGERDPVALARARLYGVADDVRWALAGFCAGASQAGSGIEYSRYSNWRLQKALCAVTNGGHFERWMKEAR